MSKDEPEIPSVEQLQKSLAERPEVQAYLAPYSKTCWNSFLRSYAYKLQYALKFGEQVREWQQERPIKHLDDAEYHFWEIQQKKLFDLQCRWRAELVKLDGVESTYDFDHWEKHIDTCPFLTPVTGEEFDMYLSYVKSSHFEFEQHHWYQYQGYNEIKDDLEESADSSSIPPWYTYHWLMTGTRDLLLLPDIRGEKEERYMDVARQKNREKHLANQPARSPEEQAEFQKPYLIGSEEEILAMAAKVESPETLKLFKAGSQEMNYHTDLEDIISAIQYLGETNEVFPFEPGKDWREQVLLTENRRKTLLMLEALPSVFADYQMRMQLGLGYHNKEENPSPLVKSVTEMSNGIRHILKDMVMQGRKILQEPEDWNF